MAKNLFCSEKSRKEKKYVPYRFKRYAVAAICNIQS